MVATAVRQLVAQVAALVIQMLTVEPRAVLLAALAAMAATLVGTSADGGIGGNAGSVGDTSTGLAELVPEALAATAARLNAAIPTAV